MSNNNLPLHSTATLIRSSIAAMFVAALVLVCFILPSEYNIDPSGVGKALGLTQLAQAKEQPSAPLTPVQSKDTVEIEIPSGRGLEYKLIMEKHAQVDYQWSTQGSEALYFDFHGEPRGDTTGYFKSFAIATTHTMKGSLTTPFAGSHGWYWKNTSSEAIMVSLSIAGDYKIKE